MEESGAVCRCNVARGFALLRVFFVELVSVGSVLEMSDRVSCDICPVRSCDAVATVIVWASVEVGVDRRQKEVIGALCNEALDVMDLE